MHTPVLLVDEPRPHVLRLRINRPDKRNAINLEVRAALTDAIVALRTNSGIRALVFGGEGGVFSAGGDVPSMLGLNEAQARAHMQHIHGLCRLVAGLGLPVVSAIEGVGAGGAVGLALLGDHIVVGENSKILFPFLKLGLTPDWGQLLTLPQRVGLPTALRLFTASEPVGGPEALHIGLADAMVPDEQVMQAAIDQASAWAQLPQEAFARMKARLGQPLSSLADELAREENDQAVCLLGDDFLEGYDAFKHKRSANFITRPGARP